MEVRPERKISISMKNLVLYSRKRAGKTMADRLSAEIMDAFNPVSYTHLDFGVGEFLPRLLVFEFQAVETAQNAVVCHKSLILPAKIRNNRQLSLIHI